VITLRDVTDLRTPPVHDGDLFSERVSQFAYEKPLRRVHILFAGSGQGAELDLARLDAGHVERHVTGVDVDAPELRARTMARSDLDSWHLGDLRTVPMPPRAYDIVCAPYLIDRIANAELVLDRIVAALKPGGLMILQFRDRDTAFGLVDRLIPPRLRRLLQAGPVAPPAVYEPVASRRGMQWYCVMRGLVISGEQLSQDTVHAYGRWAGLVQALGRTAAALSRGRLTSGHGEVTLVIRKPENRFARVI
jgi:SAM-dependent methyltransferase